MNSPLESSSFGLRELHLPAPAKINLFLHVTGRRADGYHELQTVFQFLDYCDQLRLERRDDGKVVRVCGPATVSPEADLCVRAARTLKQATGCRLGADIAVTKRLPMGGGIGGGSSDAATALHGLNLLWGLGLDHDALSDLGLDLGADVPVFVRGQAAFAEGVGEKLSPVSPPCPWYLLVHPGFGVNTGGVFADDALTRCTPPLTIPALFLGTSAARSSSENSGVVPYDVLRRLHSCTTNDCEAVVRRTHPEVAEAMAWLSNQPGVVTPARMSGAGSSVFAPFESDTEAQLAHSRLPARWRGVVARAVNQSPLMAALNRVASACGPASRPNR
ncbi:MAG: 4-(cytidine 5'-diphospho)-2-C-methyl-D-erythritol kinase [Gammaproteobacteria bacterium]